MGGHDGPTLVLAPLPEELRALRQRLTPIERVHVPGLRRACRGSLQGSPTVLAVTGDGERKALRGIETALATFRPSHLLVIGVAGALTPELDVGDVIAARQVLQPDGQPREPSHELLARAVESGIPAGTVLTTTRLADAAGVPWLVLRAVSDTATESLPPYLERCRDEGGAVQRGRVALQGLLRPWSLPVLLRLGRRVRLCSETLAEILIRMKSGSVGRSEGEAARHRRM
jgi:hypothetical protein